jgi:hypothetical protein
VIGLAAILLVFGVNTMLLVIGMDAILLVLVGGDTWFMACSKARICGGLDLLKESRLKTWMSLRGLWLS